jgi:hypothetical protein
MNRIFGKAKAASTEAAAPPPDIGATASKIDGRVEELDKKVGLLNTFVNLAYTIYILVRLHYISFDGLFRTKTCEKAPPSPFQEYYIHIFIMLFFCTIMCSYPQPTNPTSPSWSISFYYR